MDKSVHTITQLNDSNINLSKKQVLFGSMILLFISFALSILDVKNQLVMLVGFIVLAIGMFILYKRPIFILYALLILAPLDTFFSRLLTVTGITDKGTLLKDGLVLLLFIVILGKGLFSLIKSPKSIKIQRIDLLFILVVIFMFLQSFRLPYLPAGIYGFRGIVWFAIIFFYIRYCTNEKHIKTILFIGFFMSGIVAIYGLLQFIIGAPAIEFLGYNPGDVAFRTTFGFLRVTSTTDGSGTLAAYVLIWICLSMGMFLYLPRKRRRLFLGLLILLIVNLILTTMRAAWLGVGFAFAIGWLFNTRMKKLTSPMILLALIIFASANYATDGFFANRFLSVVGLGNDPQSHASNDTHLQSVRIGLDYFWEAPILGHGVGMTGIPSIKYAEFLPEGEIGLDNLYLKFLVETGLVGFLLFSGLYSVVIGLSFKAYRQAVSKPRKGAALGILMAYCGLGVYFLVHSILESPLINIMFWMMFAMIFLLLRYPGKHHDHISQISSEIRDL